MKILCPTILAFLFFCFPFKSYSQLSDGYFEYLDHFEQRYFGDLLPVSDSDSYIWTGKELLQIGQDTIFSVYKLSSGTGANLEFFTNDNDTTMIISNIIAFDLFLPEIIVLEKNGDKFYESVFTFENEFLYEVIPFNQNSFLGLSNNRLISFDNTNDVQLIAENLSFRSSLATNINKEVFLLSPDNQTGEFVLFGTDNLELTPLYQSQFEVLDFQVSNDSIAYFLTNNSIEILDLKNGMIENIIEIEESFGTVHTFSGNENFDQFYVFSKLNKAYINRYDINGYRELLYTEETPNPQVNKIYVQDNLIYTTGNLYRSGHYKVQEDRSIEAFNRKDLQLNELEVLFLGIDTFINIIPTTPPDTLISFRNKYEYTLEVENIDTETITGYNTFSNEIFFDPPFDIIDQSLIDREYLEPINPGQTQIHTHQFSTELNIQNVSFTLEGIENKPDADYSNNFAIDQEFEIVSARDILSNLNKVKVYPNPSSDIMYFKSEVDIYSAQIYDATGHLHYAKMNQNPISEIEISTLSAGIYFIQLVNEKGLPISVNKITKI